MFTIETEYVLQNLDYKSSDMVFRRSYSESMSNYKVSNKTKWKKARRNRK